MLSEKIKALPNSRSYRILSSASAEGCAIAQCSVLPAKVTIPLSAIQCVSQLRAQVTATKDWIRDRSQYFRGRARIRLARLSSLASAEH
jgi:hypothetical protein